MKNPINLQERFPDMLSGKQLSLSIAKGWESLFEKLCIDIDAQLGSDKRGFHWVQLKEKFGSARFYWEMQGEPQALRIDEIDKLGAVKTLLARDVKDESNPTLQEQISALVDAAADKTPRMCIACGQPGRGHADRGWLLILCEEHIKQREAGIDPVF